MIFSNADLLHLCLLRPHFFRHLDARPDDDVMKCPVRTVICGYRVDPIVCGLEAGRSIELVQGTSGLGL